MTRYDFSKLTPAQQEVLTFCGWNLQSNRTRPGKRTVRNLIDRGLVIEHLTPTRAGPWNVTVREYEVPIPVHMAWCEHCSQQIGANE